MSGARGQHVRESCCSPLNLAGWDNEPRIAPRAEPKVTFTYAVIADGGIILCADSQVTHTHRATSGQVIGTYEGQRSKIRRIRGQFAFSIAGNAGLADTLLAHIDQKRIGTAPGFEEVVEVYQQAFRKIVKKHYRDPEQRKQAAQLGVAFLFCGFADIGGRGVPQIAKLDIATGFFLESDHWCRICGNRSGSARRGLLSSSQILSGRHASRTGETPRLLRRF